MKLHYFRSPHGNFGDDLNAWLWPELMPDVWDDGRDGITFVGAGVEEATLYGLFVERACKAQIEIAATGWAWTTPRDDAGYDRKMGSGGQGASYHATFFDYFARRLERS